MNRKQKSLIDRLEASGQDFARYLAQLSDAELFTSSAPTEWTIHQAAAHMRDTEQYVFLARVERIMNEVHPAVQNFDQGEHWQTHPYSAKEPLEKIISDFRAARRKLIARLKKSSNQDWANRAAHSAYGKISLEWLAMHNYHHTLEHIAQIGYAREKQVLAELKGAR
ncbi:MAG: DinB family protein [Chloroflexi bacterium]|nr:DinB family protein [Chloroflexota bacterium]